MPGFFGFDEGADSIDRFGDGRGYFRKRRGVGRLNAENADGDVLRKQIEKKRNRDPVRRKSDSRAILGIDAPEQVRITLPRQTGPAKTGSRTDA